jgi:hypothetical protein
VDDFFGAIAGIFFAPIELVLEEIVLPLLQLLFGPVLQCCWLLIEGLGHLLCMLGELVCFWSFGPDGCFGQEKVQPEVQAHSHPTPPRPGEVQGTSNMARLFAFVVIAFVIFLKVFPPPPPPKTTFEKYKDGTKTYSAGCYKHFNFPHYILSIWS